MATRPGHLVRAKPHKREGPAPGGCGAVSWAGDISAEHPSAKATLSSEMNSIGDSRGHRRRSGRVIRQFAALHMSQSGATRTFRNVRYPVVMGWQADLEETVLNKLDLMSTLANKRARRRTRL
jgi:hypothetical protein